MVALTGFPIGILISSIFIDILTLVIALPYRLIKGTHLPKKIRPEIKRKYSEFAIIIPAYNEQDNISTVIRSAFNQTIPPKKVIVVNDCSTDKTAEVLESLKPLYPNLMVINQPKNRGKAYNTRYALFNHVNEELTIVLDADTCIAPTYLEEISKPFHNKRVVIATGMSLPYKQRNFFGRVIWHGSVFQYRFFAFRKYAQEIRNAISVVTGDSAAYRTSYLKAQGGLPQGTQTEDMDITWRALEQGYRIVFQYKARAQSKDAATLKGHWKQIARWYAGGFQCLSRHGRNLFKSPSLLFTTLLPTFFDSIIYSFFFLTAPFFLFIYPPFTIGFYIADLTFTLLALLLVDRKNLINLPQIYLIKILWSLAWLYAGTKTLIEVSKGKKSWTGRWARDSFYASPKKPKSPPSQGFTIKKTPTNPASLPAI